MFAHDRDLLVLEPGLVNQIGWASQTLVRGGASIGSGQLMFDGVDMLAAGVSVGMVAKVGAVVVEIIAIDSGERADVSLIRASVTDAQRTPPDVSGEVGAIVTFTPQIALVHSQLLRMIGVEAGVTIPGDGGAAREDRIVNAADLTLLESLGTLHTIYAGAAALSGADSPAQRRAEMYRERFARERWRAEALIDLDGDGVPDATRRFNTTVLTRG